MMTALAQRAEIAAAWASAVVGDPHPAPHGRSLCLDSQPTTRMVCTRQHGHDGQHVATTPTHVVAVWPGGTR